MGILQYGINLYNKLALKPSNYTSTEFPIKGGQRRSSAPLPELGNNFVESYASTFKYQPKVALKLLEVIEFLAIYNPDFSYAVDNIVQLSSTEREISFSSEVLPAMRRKMINHLKKKSKTWYWKDNGLEALITDLFAQCAIDGTLSSETIPDINFQGVEQVVLVPPSQVEFFFDKDTKRFEPYQKTPGANLYPNKPELLGYTKLNTNQYKYRPIRRMNDCPYAIPPLASALEHTKLERDILGSLRTIVSRVGAFGFLSVGIKKPTGPNMLPGSAAYREEVERLMTEAYEEAEKGFGNGLAVGIGGDTTFKIEGQPGNISGSEAIFQLVNTLKISGLKQDPLMLGRNFSTTEAIGRVILTKLSEQIDNYQTTVASYLHFIFDLELKLAGFNYEHLEVKFKSPLVSDVKKDAEARSAVLDNLTKLYQQGIISQEQYAEQAGYETPDQKEPRGPVAVGNQFPYPGSPTSKKEGGAAKPKVTKSSNIVQLESAPTFLYGDRPTNIDISFNRYLEQYGVMDTSLGKWLKEYYTKVLSLFNDATSATADDITRSFSETAKPENISEAQDLAQDQLYKSWQNHFIVNLNPITAFYVSKIYDYFRKQGNPSSMLLQDDLGLIQYFVESDNLYLGKFITDKDVIDSLRNFIKDKFEAGELPNRTTTAALESEFRGTFRRNLDLEKWKLERVINTSVNRATNAAVVRSMAEMKVDSYVIKGVPGPKQCKYCRLMQGRTFSVPRTVELLNIMKTSPASMVRVHTPFINTVFSNADDILKVSDSGLQDLGICLPPFHSHCVDIAILV